MFSISCQGQYAQIDIHFCNLFIFPTAMPPIQITTSPEIMREYFGTDNLGLALMKMEEREDGRPLEFSDAELDTSLFPYEASGPLDTPLPTLAEIAAARAAVPDTPQDSMLNTGAIQTVRVGPYMVKYGLAVEILQVGCSQSNIF